MKVSVIVPILYTEPQLEETLRPVVSMRDRLDLEVLLVIDVPDPAREPETRTVNESLGRELQVRTEYRVGERGFGSALRFGFAKASGDVLIPLMADACDDPGDIPRLVKKVERGCDVVAGSRYMLNGGIVGNTMKQRLSHFYSVLVRLVGGPPIHDISNAFKAYRRTVIQAVPTIAESFDVSVELTLKAYKAGFIMGEIPTVWTNRQQGTSKFSFGSELNNYGRWLLYALTHRTRLPETVRTATRGRGEG